MALFKIKDPVEVARGKVLQQRFKPPEGLKPGPFNSYIGAFKEYAAYVAKAGTEPQGGFDAWLPKELDTFMNKGSQSQVSPRPRTSAIQDVQDIERRSLKKRRGYRSTIMTRGGLLAADTRKARVLGV